MLIRTYADIEKLEGNHALSDAECSLIENCKRGEPTVLGDGKLPDGPNSKRNIRAGLLRYLILGGCEQCQMRELGVQLSGAQIVGKLDISFARTVGGVILNHCAFDMPIAASQAHLDRLDLSGCRLLGMNAESVMVRGDICFDQVKCHGTLSISGGEIGGQLVVVGAELNGSEDQAFIAQGVLIRGGVFLENLKSIGEVSFAGAEIGVQFSAEEADFNGGDGISLNAQSATIKGGAFLKHVKSTGEISFMGAEIDFQLSFEGADLNGGKGRALNGQGMVVSGGLFWRNLSAVVGLIHLNTAQLGDLVDDKESWGKVSLLSLIGLTYSNLISPMDLTFRKRWLKLGSTYKGQFYPQPYQQLAKFYRETGHRYEAREILVAKEIEQRKATRKAILQGQARTESWLHPKVLAALNFLWDWTTRLIAGYGYKPWLSLWWLGGLVAIMMGLAQLTWTAGDFAPNSAVILTSQDWKTIADGPSENPAADWTETHAPGKDYETFYSFAYALDVVVPVLDLGQTDAWAPSPARGNWGYWMFYAQKMFIVAGWVVTAIAAAAISGMIRRDD